MDREKVKVGEKYMMKWGDETVQVTVTHTGVHTHTTLRGEKVSQYRFTVRREDGRRTVVAASRLKNLT